MEGLPAPAGTARRSERLRPVPASPGRRSGSFRGRGAGRPAKRLYVVDSFHRLRALVPGLCLVAPAVAVSFLAGRLLTGVSPAVVAVALGIVLGNLGGVHASFRPGLRLASRPLLRLAIVLLGLQIALPEILALGWRTLALVAAATGVTFVATRRAGRLLGVDPRRSLLIATGVSVCGAAAIAAMHEVAGSDDDDVASAVGVVVLYGSAAIVVVPALGGLLGLTPHQLGLWAGASVHEVAQVAAIGAAAGTGVLATAVVVKLTRVVLLAPLVALVSAGLRRAPADRARRAGDADAAPPARQGARAGRRPPPVPLFVAGFVAMLAVRATGLVPGSVTAAVPEVTGVLLAAALFGLGTGIELRKLVRGGRALALGGVATAIIVMISLFGALAIG
ncbi:putative sulfate exporter family transporter [Planomonospora sp. ID67723]|nr:putative sulfate exporter family transporter [Planomonospora sp. ID67723]